MKNFNEFITEKFKEGDIVSYHPREKLSRDHYMHDYVGEKGTVHHYDKKKKELHVRYGDDGIIIYDKHEQKNELKKR